MNTEEINSSINRVNPFLTLNYEPALASLGDDYYDPVTAAEFPPVSQRPGLANP
jgi:serine/tyrosine/threonine adenylyltransferase